MSESFISSKLDILILTEPDRQPFLDQLLPEISQQIGQHPVRVLITAYDPKLTLGDNRNKQLAEAEAEYVAFVDDDDWIALDYFDRIMPLLDRDYVGFRVTWWAQHMSWQTNGQAIHSLMLPHIGKDDPWWKDGKGNYYRGLSHLNPIRRLLALEAKFDAGKGEDYRWAKRLWLKGIVQTQHYIDSVMYHYLWRAAKNDRADAENPGRLALIEKIKRGELCLQSSS